MALIFDRFKSIEDAAGFVAAVKSDHGRDAQLYTNEGEAADAGYFPFQLDGAAVVLVEREADDGEEEIIALVKAHGGAFAGT
jgi:hypothetical protein